MVLWLGLLNYICILEQQSIIYKEISNENERGYAGYVNIAQLGDAGRFLLWAQKRPKCEMKEISK